MSRSLERKRLDVVERLRVRRPDALETVSTYLLGSGSDMTGAYDAQLEIGWREVASACLDCGLLAIEQGDEWTGSVPPIIVVQERRAVLSGMDLPTSIARYTTAYRLAWEYVLEELGYSDISHQERMLVQRQASKASLSLLTTLLAEVAYVHLGELKDGVYASSQNNARLVRRILAGEPVHESEIDYDFDAEHVGIIAWGEGATTALTSVAHRLGYQRLIVSNDDGTVWAWLSRSKICSTEDIAAALDRDIYRSVFAAVGKSMPKLNGFRDTHGLAQAAYRVAKLSGQRITLYSDVACEARVLQDPVHARWLIRTYATPIMEHREGTALRKTLEKFYEAAHNVDKAAKLLKTDWHTVRRHVNKVGEIVGHPHPTYHADMELALSLVRLNEGASDLVSLSAVSQ